MVRNNGGQAFPGGYYTGMTLRDWYAGQALATMDLSDVFSPEAAAGIAFDIADAMIAEREVRNNRASPRCSDCDYEERCEGTRAGCDCECHGQRPEPPEFPVYHDAQGNEHGEF